MERRVTYHIYKNGHEEWRWRLVAANGRIVAVSGEGYHNKADCLDAVEVVKGSTTATVVNAEEEPTR